MTKPFGQSIGAIAIALGLGGGVASLFLIHYIASEVGYLIWTAVTIGPAMAAALYLASNMTGYHVWARLAVGVIIFFSVGLIIMASLEVHHF